MDIKILINHPLRAKILFYTLHLGAGHSGIKPVSTQTSNDGSWLFFLDTYY